MTDGLDGLAAGCSFITFVALLPLTAFVAGVSTLAVLYNLMAIALCLGFLWHNCNPASVFMGDVGAHFLAGSCSRSASAPARSFISFPSASSSE